MDSARLIEVLRYPLEFIALGLAFAPALFVLQCWDSLPRQIPVRFTSAGRPDGWASRGWALGLPLIALIVYGVMSQATGTWAWVIDRRAEIPNGSEILIFLKPGFGFLIVSATGMLMRVARREEESLNGWLLWGLMTLLVTPPLVLSMVVR